MIGTFKQTLHVTTFVQYFCDACHHYVTVVFKPNHGGMQSCISLSLSQARNGINWDGCGRKGIQCKNGRIDGGGLLIGPDGVVLTQIVSVSASCYPPSTLKSRRSFLLAAAHPDGPRKRAIKQLWCRLIFAFIIIHINIVIIIASGHCSSVAHQD